VRHMMWSTRPQPSHARSMARHRWPSHLAVAVRAHAEPLAPQAGRGHGAPPRTSCSAPPAVSAQRRQDRMPRLPAQDPRSVRTRSAESAAASCTARGRALSTRGPGRRALSELRADQPCARAARDHHAAPPRGHRRRHTTPDHGAEPPRISG
jgi:hypothetical protein